jgi:pimeloyl-ACP methyl ester carboxylesterase
MTSCIKLDFFLFDSEPADLEDYDFVGDPMLDGIPEERIVSELVPSADPDEMMHVIWVERDVAKLDERIGEERNVTVIYSHGNRGNNRWYWHRVALYEDMGFNVLMYDYRGYGASGGETSERHMYEDVDRAYEVAMEKGAGEVLSVGYSIGAPPALWLCSPESGREVMACVTEAAFASTAKLLRDGMAIDVPSEWMLDAEFDCEAMIGTVDVPVMLIHGTEDKRVAFENSEILWRIARDRNPLSRFWAVEGAGHRNVFIPSYTGSDLPVEYSHPDELPVELHEEYEVYRERIVEFVADQ